MHETSSTEPLLTAANYTRGMLVDGSWMAGISKESEGFLAFVVDHADASIVARQTFSSLDDAITALNQIPRDWKFESANGCSGERCGEGKCKGEGCKIYVGPKKTSCES